jgi:hypothetical protein
MPYLIPHIAVLTVKVLLNSVPIVYKAFSVVENSIVSSVVPSAFKDTVCPLMTRFGTVTVSVVPSAVEPDFITTAILYPYPLFARPPAAVEVLIVVGL